MQASIQTLAFRGLEPVPVHVQVHLSNGLPNIAIVGLADKAVSDPKKESGRLYLRWGYRYRQNGLRLIWHRLI